MVEIAKKVPERRLKWYGHVLRRDKRYIGRRAMEMKVQGRKKRDRPVPARYVRHSQMCPQLDVSDKNDQKTQDMSDKARFVRQK